MISRQHRFHGHTSLNFVYRRGATVRNQQISLRYVRNGRLPAFRAAVIVSRKVHKSAVRRNRIRRRIYEQVRAHAPEITVPVDLVFTVFSERLADMPAAQLAELIAGLLVRADAVVPGAHPLPAADHDIVTMNRGRA